MSGRRVCASVERSPLMRPLLAPPPPQLTLNVTKADGKKISFPVAHTFNAEQIAWFKVRRRFRRRARTQKRR
jgi:hypothetical protein